MVGRESSSPPLLGSLSNYVEVQGNCTCCQSFPSRDVSPAGREKTGCQEQEMYRLTSTCPLQSQSSPQALETQREKALGKGFFWAPGGQTGKGPVPTASSAPLWGPAHLVLRRLWVQQLELALEELVIWVQWVWHLLHFLCLLGGCLQGLGQLDVCQHLRGWALAACVSP